MRVGRRCRKCSWPKGGRERGGVGIRWSWAVGGDGGAVGAFFSPPRCPRVRRMLAFRVFQRWRGARTFYGFASLPPALRKIFGVGCLLLFTGWAALITLDRFEPLGLAEVRWSNKFFRAYLRPTAQSTPPATLPSARRRRSTSDTASRSLTTSRLWSHRGTRQWHADFPQRCYTLLLLTREITSENWPGSETRGSRR